LIESVLRSLLSEVNPKPHYGSQQHQAEHDIDSMFRRCLVRGLALWYANSDGFHFVVDGREGQTGEALAVRSWRHQADPDQHQRTDHEHEDRVMQEVHIDKPAGS